MDDFKELRKRQKQARDTAYATLRKYAGVKLYGEGFYVSDDEARTALALLEMQDYHGWLKIEQLDEQEDD